MLIVRLSSIRFWTVLPFLFWCFPGTLPAGPGDFEGKRIALIAFEPTQQPLPAEELARILPVKTGEPLRMADVRTAIERLHSTGRYAGIDVDAEVKEGEVVLRFLTKNTWFVGRVWVTGVPAPPGAAELAVATKLDLGRRFREEDASVAVANIQETLRNNGFFNSAVHPRFVYDPRTQQINIEFAVEPGRRDRFAAPVVKGEPGASPGKITGVTRWKGWFGWRPVTASRVQRGVERVREWYQKRNHLMARVTLDRLEHDAGTWRSTPTLTIEAGPAVLVESAGARLERGRLKRLVPVFEEQSVDQDLLMEGARNIRDYFHADGYFNTKVDFSSDLNEQGKRRILYTIDRGERSKLVHVDIRGNRYFDDDTIRERMSITPTSLQVRRGRFSGSMLKRDLEAISELYRDNGFREVKLSSRVENDYRGNKGDLAVFIEIEEGKQTLIASLNLEGVSPGDEQVLRSRIHSLPGQPFSEANVAVDRETILSYYYNGGYPDAAFEWSFQPSSKPNMVDVNFVLTEGPRQLVREVLISGLESTRPQLVNRQILVNPGEPISQAMIMETQRRLYGLGIFSQVDTAVQNPDGDEEYKYVLFQLEESRKYSASSGLGAEIARIGGGQRTLESPGGEAGFSPRVSFDFSRLNFLGRAHTVSLRTRASTLQRRALVTYLAPHFRGSEHLDVSFTALFEDSRDIRTFSARRWEGSVQLGHRWTRSKTLVYRFAYRRVAVDQNTLNIRPALIPLLSQPVRVGTLNVGYVDDRRDNPADSRKGIYNQVDLGLASKVFGSQADFSRLLARNSTYHPIGTKLVLARTFSFAWLNPLRANPAVSAADQIPLPERIFSGGSSTLRAFPQNQAGPRDTITGFPLGGNAMLIFGTEIRFPLFGPNLSGAMFHDTGNVYSRIQDVSVRFRQRDTKDFNYMVHGVGLGVRYRTPIGPVRADFSFSPNSPRFYGFKGTRDELLFGGGVRTLQRISRFQFHFSLGQSF